MLNKGNIIRGALAAAAVLLAQSVTKDSGKLVQGLVAVGAATGGIILAAKVAS